MTHYGKLFRQLGATLLSTWSTQVAVSGQVKICLQKRKMARVTGLEPATSGVTGRHSNQLSYTRAKGSNLTSLVALKYELRNRKSRIMTALFWRPGFAAETV